MTFTFKETLEHEKSKIFPSDMSESTLTLLAHHDNVIKALEKQIPPKKNWEEECCFCRTHEAGDTLYEDSSWDGGIGFDYVRDIKYCPICGRRLIDE